jgi:hypothetical protein
VPLSKRPFRVIVQRRGDSRDPKFRIIAYGDDPISAIADYNTLPELLNALAATLPDVVLNLSAEGSVIFTGEIEMDESQLKALRLA